MQQISIHSSAEEALLEYINDRELDVNYVYGYIIANLQDIKKQQFAHKMTLEVMENDD